MLLHSSSLHYYACYCALICLLCQQQQQPRSGGALAVTIIIDGATSNEWATRDEYGQRLATATNTAEGGASSSQDYDAQTVTGDGSGGGGGDASSRLAVKLQQASNSEPNAAAAADLADLIASAGGATQRRPLATGPVVESPEESLLRAISFKGSRQQQQQQQQQQHQLDQQEQLAAPVDDEFDQALDRLDLIERQRQAEVGRLRELAALERAAESGVARALGHQAQAAGLPTAGLADLPPGAYVALASANRRRKARDVPKRRCGDDLVRTLEFVCKQRFYNGESQPEVVQPVIKSKRSVSGNGGGQDDGAPVGQVARRRKLRTLHQATQVEGDGYASSASLPASLSSSLSLSSSSSSASPEASPSAAAASSQQQPFSSSPSSSSSISSSSPVNNDGINNTPHNHLLHRQQAQQQQLEYLSSNQSNNLRDKINSKRALLRRVRGVSEECCERSCTIADMEAYCANSQPAKAR